MEGKVVMVTGANAGMGRQISLELANAGATVVMVCRSRERGEAALREVKELTGNPDVELSVADLASQVAIRALARGLADRHDRLHVLVNNAGVSLRSRTETVDGIEAVLATNHLAPFLLTNLLLPVLEVSAPSRVVNVSSGAQAMARLDLDDLQSIKRYNEINAYNQTKLLNLMFTYELARRLQGTGVTANAVDPGFVKTNLRVPFPFSLFSFMRVPLEKGAHAAVCAATSPAMEGVSGQFLDSRGVAKRSIKVSYDEEAARRLWQISAELTGLGHGTPAA